MSIYHAGKNNKPLCGQAGSIGGFTAVALKPAEWNQLEAHERCQKCVAKIQAMKAAKAKG